jgi:hypothetical protein
MRRRCVFLLLLLVMAVSAVAQTPRQIRVALDFRQTAEQTLDGVQGGGSVIITERDGVRPQGGVGVGSVEHRVRRSRGIFTLVQDGSESLLTVATQIPYLQIAFYRDYATGAGYVARGVVFQDVGTSLKVQAVLFPGNQIRVRLIPRISYVAADGSGALEFTEAFTELVVPNGRPVMLGGVSRESHVVLRQVLGRGRERGASEASVVLTATAQ